MLQQKFRIQPIYILKTIVFLIRIVEYFGFEPNRIQL